MPKRGNQPIQGELLQGTLDLLILKTLALGPAHGHTIAYAIEHRSEEVLQVEHGSLYPALHRLEDRGWIASFWGTSENNRKARYYRLTPKGRKQLEAQTTRWDETVRGVNRGLRPASEWTVVGLTRFLRRRFWDEERARELEAYLQQEIDDNIARGLTPDHARAAAYRKLGNPTLIREEIYTMNSLGWLESIWQDLRYGARIRRRNRVFAIVTIVSLALGIGANTAIFALVDAIEFRALPVRAPQQLAEVRIANGRWGNATGRRAQATNAIWEDVRKQQHSFAGVLAWGVG